MFRFQNKIRFFFLLPRRAGGYNLRSVCRKFGRQARHGRHQAGSYHGAPRGKAQAGTRASEAHVPRCRKGQPADGAAARERRIRHRTQPARRYREQGHGADDLPAVFPVCDLPAEFGTRFWDGTGFRWNCFRRNRCRHRSTKLTPWSLRVAAKFTVPQPADSEVDLNSTTFLSHVIRRWGKTGISLLNGWDLRQHRYGFIGLEDWSMYPVLRPGSLVLIDETRRRIEVDGWTSEMNRPIYFLEHRDGYRCGWCTPYDNHILVQPHPSSHRKPDMYGIGEIDVIGQVTGVAMLLETSKRRHVRSGAVPAASPNP